MSTPTPRVITISPLQVPFRLKTGAYAESMEFRQLLSEVGQLDPAIHIGKQTLDQQYQDLSKDDVDVCLFRWQQDHQDAQLTLHIFPNSIAIAEIILPTREFSTSAELEDWSQQYSSDIIDQLWPKFLSLLKRIDTEITSSLLERGQDIHSIKPEAGSNLNKPKIHWISRTLAVDSNQLQQAATQSLITEWLSQTEYPQQAQDIIAGQRFYSMTWLNYVVVDAEPTGDYRLESMVLAQYYYTAQENCLQQLKQAIAAAYAEDQLKAAEKQLSQSRVATRLHLIDYHEQRKTLTRPKLRLLSEILDSWKFDSLVDNSQRMIDVCSSRLEEVDHQRRERSTVMTDLLLVTLSFFAVFELSLYLVEFSREMMSRPALDYNDENTSFFLSKIAEVDTDVMFAFGFLLTLGLVLVYKRIKSH
ncbi:MAG: hypothetical protein ACRBBW_13795 [Cellvibrionaceae bacterium]